VRRSRSGRRARLLTVALGLVLLAFGVGAGGRGGAGQAADRATGPAASATSGSAAAAAVRATSPARPYRWLVTTQGGPPSVASENRAPGTTAWRLPGGPGTIGGVGSGDVEGYVSAQAVVPGQTETVYVSAGRARTVTVSVYRIGWYGGRGGRLVLASSPLRVIRQPACAHSWQTGMTQCRWRATLSFPIPTALASGVYVVKLATSAGARRDCLFVVRAASPPPLLVQIPTATYEAYNSWGGDSLYPGGTDRVGATGTTQGVAVSYDRPYASQTGAGQFFVREVALVRFLERYGYASGYTTDASLDADPRQLAGVRAFVDAGHSEYWSPREEQALAAARDRGTSLLFLSSDTLAWRIRYAPGGRESSAPRRPDQTIVAYKEFAARDPDRGQPTGVFPLGGAQLAGSAYDGCITPRLPLAGPPAYRYYPWRPAPGLRPAWLFAGTGVTAGTQIPGIAGYELDERTPAAPAGTLLVGASAGAACMGEGEPSPAQGITGETTLYETRSGALVFATGMLGWLYGLSPVPQASPDVPRVPDARIVAITRNVLERALRPRLRRAR
jgi:hypothetical protein